MLPVRGQRVLRVVGRDPIRAGAEVVTGAAHDDGAQRLVDGRGLERSHDPGNDRGVERVLARGAVERDVQDAVVRHNFDAVDAFLAHDRLPPAEWKYLDVTLYGEPLCRRNAATTGD